MTMDLTDLIRLARDNGASDLHLEPGLPAALRIRGSLRTLGDPVSSEQLAGWARELIGEDQWPAFEERRSHDASRDIGGVRCRLNLFQTQRGYGLAVRLLGTFQVTLERLNLHPDLRRLVQSSHGLILVSGPTGSGKSSTLAALIQEINSSEACHILTIESPIEHLFHPQRAFIRQREVGRDTPSFAQALVDALREDPDVLMVGELRDPETMRLTLNAAETGHLVMSTVHSSSCAEALQRIIGAFPAEIQSAVASQLADCLLAVICQRLQYRADLRLRLPECEILIGTHPVRAHIRSREFFKIPATLETGANSGMWTWARYRSWMDKNTRWQVPEADTEHESAEPKAATAPRRRGLPPPLKPASGKADAMSPGKPAAAGPIEIEPAEGGLGDILRRME